MIELSDLWQTETPIGEIVIRLVLAVVLSTVIGYEREEANKPAGLRTHMLVALASCGFTLIAIEMVGTMVDEGPGLVQVDLIRVIEAVVAGVAFLGAGAIIQSRGNLIGITTGASMWLVGAIGLACGGGYYVIAFLLLILAMITLTLIRVIEGRFLSKKGRGKGGRTEAD